MLGFNELLPFEEIRIAYSILYLAILSYYDLKHDRNIPERVIYLLSALALPFLALYPVKIIQLAVGEAIVIAIIFYLLYKAGQVGFAEVLVFASLAILLPVPPKITGIIFSIPFIIPILIFSSLAFSMFFIVYAIRMLMLKKIKIKMNGGIVALLIVYALFSFLFFKIGGSIAVFGLISFLLIASLLYEATKEEFLKSMVVEMPVEKAEEEVVALAYERKKVKEILGKAVVLTKDKIERLKKERIKTIRVYRMFPFTPFILFGLILSLVFSKLLFFF